MDVLMDSHAFIWWASSPAKLSPAALTACRNPGVTLWLSMASVWEIQIKHQLGKLSLHQPLAQVIARQRKNRVRLLPIRLAHVLALETLPMHHRDPFDRLLIAQATAEKAMLLS